MLFKDVVSFKTPVGSNSIALVIKFLDRSSSIFPLLKRASLKRRWTMEEDTQGGNFSTSYL